MQVRRDFDLSFDEQTYIDMHGEQFARLLERPQIGAKVEEVFAEAPALLQPAACYDTFPIEGFLHERARLENGMSIGGGPFVSVIGGAEALVVAVCTIGGAIHERARAYQAEYERFKAMVLDELGSWAVDQIRMQLFEDLAAAYKAEGWRTSAVLSPGESTWSVRDQKKIFRLLEPEAIGVTLSEGYVMSPLKSLSLVFGTGRQPLGVEDADNCDFCTIKDQCRYREMRPAVH